MTIIPTHFTPEEILTEIVKENMFTLIGWILAHSIKSKRKAWKHASNYGMSYYKFGRLRKIW